MKKILATLAALMITAVTYGQNGQVNFSTKVGTEVDAQIKMPDGSAPGAVAGNPFTAQLLYINGTSTTPVIPTVGFRATPVGVAQFYTLNGGAVDVPGTTSGQLVTLRLVAFNGGSFATSTVRGQSTDFTVTLGGGLVTPPNLAGLTGFTLVNVPEPSTIALGVLGLGALLIRRRK